MLKPGTDIRRSTHETNREGGEWTQTAGPYSHAVVFSGFVFVSGQGPVDPETGTMPDAFEDQIRQTLKNVQTILEAAGRVSTRS